MRPRLFALYACAVLHAGVAAAQPVADEESPEARALAEALFTEGRRLLNEGSYDLACPKLAESHRLDPAGGTLMNLATCERLRGRLATAHAHFTDALAMARKDGRDDRIAICRRELDEIAPNIPGIVVKVAEADAERMELRVGGIVIPALAWGTRIAVDPGAISVQAAMPDRVAWEGVASVGLGETIEVRVPPLARAPGARPKPSRRSPEPPPAAHRDDTRHDGRLEASARLDVDGQLRGAAVFTGVGYGVASGIDVGVGALLGAHPGVELDTTLFPLRGNWKPMFIVGMPVFFERHVTVGGRIGAGLQWDPIAPFGVFALVGGAFFPDAPPGFSRAVFVPSLGVQARLDAR